MPRTKNDFPFLSVPSFLISIYVYGIVGTMLLKGRERYRRFYGTLLAAIIIV